MGGVEDDGVTGLAEVAQAGHVDHQPPVAEGGAALGHHGRRAARVGDLLDDVGHIPRREELPLLDVDRLARARSGHEEVRLAAEEGGDLEEVDHLRDGRALLGEVDIGHHRHADLGLDFREPLEALVHPRPAATADARAVRLVEARLEDEGQASLAHQVPEGPGDVEGELA